jgi:hypothetical protein
MSRQQPERTTRRLPPFLAEHYEVGEVDLRSAGSTSTSPSRASPSRRSTSSSTTTRSPLKTTASPKKKTPTKKKSVTERPALAQARAIPAPVVAPVVAPQNLGFAFAPPNPDLHNRFAQFQSAAVDFDEVLKSLLIQTPASATLHGFANKESWAISNLPENQQSAIYIPEDTFEPKTITVDEVLRGCYYHTGKLATLDPTQLTSRQHSIEICFIFDTTGSMFQCIDELKFKLSAIISQLLKDIPIIKISVIAMGDYADYNMFYTMHKLDFTNDQETLVQFIQSIRGTGGGDKEECYEMALLEAQTLKWSHSANEEDDMYVSKCVVVIGDDVPHDKASYFGIDWKQEMAKLRDVTRAKIYSVQCLARPEADEFYQTLADETLGQRFLLQNFEAMTDMFMGLCYREASEHALLNFGDQIQTSSTGSSIVRPQVSTRSSQDPDAMDGTDDQEVLSDEDVMRVHRAIHDRTQTSVNIAGNVYEISDQAGCRNVRINNVQYIEQNKEKKTKYAKMALEGKSLTWICTSGSWGLIIDDEVVRRST